MCRVSLQDIKEITQLREILETHILRDTAERFTGEELAQMESALRSASEALESGDIAAFLRSNRAFHHWFDRKYGNRRMSDILRNLDDHLHRIFSLGMDFDDLKASHHAHELILSAIKKGDVETAVSVLRRHLIYTERDFDRMSEARGSSERE